MGLAKSPSCLAGRLMTDVRPIPNLQKKSLIVQ